MYSEVSLSNAQIQERSDGDKILLGRSMKIDIGNHNLRTKYPRGVC